MNNPLIRTLFVLCCTCWLFNIPLMAFAQHGDISINGKVTDLEDGQPVRQASVSIAHKGIGTATNTAGMFVLMIPATNLTDTLKVSCIGFKAQKFAVANLKQGDILNVMLEKNTTLLQEVTVAYYDADKIIQKAIARIPENYINHPHIIRGFYRMYAFNEQNPLQLSEAVFDVYNFGYADERADLFRLIKARSETNTGDFHSLEVGQRPNTIFEEDIINHLHACEFLNDAGLTKHQFEVSGVTDINGYRAYEIDFKEKRGVEGNTFRGRVYIDVKTYAFIYFDFGLSPSALKNLGPSTFARKALVRAGNVEIGMLFDQTKVSYQEVGSKWVLMDVEGDASLTVKTPEDKSGYTARVKFNYQVTAVDTVQKESFNAKIGRNDNINAYKSNGDEKFWKNYNILLSDYDAEEIFNKLKIINKSVKARTEP
jgi:hypothetical protein